MTRIIITKYDNHLVCVIQTTRGVILCIWWWWNNRSKSACSRLANDICDAIRHWSPSSRRNRRRRGKGNNTRCLINCPSALTRNVHSCSTQSCGWVYKTRTVRRARLQPCTSAKSARTNHCCECCCRPRQNRFGFRGRTWRSWWVNTWRDCGVHITVQRIFRLVRNWRCHCSRKRRQRIKRHRTITIHCVRTFTRNSKRRLVTTIRGLRRANATQLHRRSSERE